MTTLKEWLKGEAIDFEENYESKTCGVLIPLRIPRYHVAVCVGDSQEFYLRTRGIYFPVFLRDEDTKDKVLEKVQNTIIKSMLIENKRLNNKRKSANAGRIVH